MSKLRNYLLTASGFTALAVALLFTNPPTSTGVPSSKDVLVINPASQPVPTAAQGTTTIAGSISFVPGTSVGIDPSNNTVQLGNTVANPVLVRDVDNPASQPFQMSATSTQTGTNVSLLDIATVPAGKRLVIEFISAVGQVPPGQHVETWSIITIAPPVGGAQHELLVIQQPPAVIGDALFRASQQVRLYADPGSHVTSTIRRNSSAGNAVFLMTLSGYLVDVP